MNVQAIIAALPWLRRLWRIMPPPLRVPLLLVAAAIGIYQFIQGRRQDGDGGATSSDTEGATVSPLPSGS